MKKLLAFALTFAFVTALSLGSVGCSKKEEVKSNPPTDMKDKAAADKKAP